MVEVDNIIVLRNKGIRSINKLLQTKNDGPKCDTCGTPNMLQKPGLIKMIYLPKFAQKSQNHAR